jgi:hypothetical protein
MLHNDACVSAIRAARARFLAGRARAFSAVLRSRSSCIRRPTTLSVSRQAFLTTFRPHALIYMGRLDHAITVLDVLGSVVQAVPVVGDGLKSATEIATKICEVVKVRSIIFFIFHALQLSGRKSKKIAKPTRILRIAPSGYSKLSRTRSRRPIRTS